MILTFNRAASGAMIGGMPPAATSSWADETLAALKAAGYRSGGARRAVIELLGRQDCCLTAQQVFDALRGEGRTVGIATVYRVLDLLGDRALVHRIELGSGTTYFEPALRGGEHHHHLVCEDCGKVEAFEDEELEKTLRRVERRTGYSVAGHEIVLRGACGSCR
jgi:Fur family ferric uptake transcriptional regulator